MEPKKKHIVYKEDFKRSAVEMVIHSGKPIVQIGRELGVSEASLHAWKKDYLKQRGPAEINGQQRSPEQMLEEIRRLQKENEYLKRQRGTCCNFVVEAKVGVDDLKFSSSQRTHRE